MERREVGKMTKKRISIALLFAVALSGCRQYKTAENVSYNARFVIISKELYGCIVYDEKTGVEYWRSEGNANGTLTLLVDRDGNPLIYAGE